MLISSGIAQSGSAAKQGLQVYLLGSPDEWLVGNNWSSKQIHSWDFCYLNSSHQLYLSSFARIHNEVYSSGQQEAQQVTSKDWELSKTIWIFFSKHPGC